jgi:hypothetical protein
MACRVCARKLICEYVCCRWVARVRGRNWEGIVLVANKCEELVRFRRFLLEWRRVYRVCF